MKPTNKNSSTFDDIKLALIVLFLLIFSVKNSGCDSDEVTVYVKKPPVEQQSAKENVIEAVKKTDLLEPPVNIFVKSKIEKPKLHLVKNCEPRCDKYETCNTETGKCEGIANKPNYKKWTPQQEHSEIFLVDSKIGTYSPGDDYLMMNR